MSLLEDSCRTIQNTVFDDDRFLPKNQRKVACFNPATGSGCCMALCTTNGYRCQNAAVYALDIDEKKVAMESCEKAVVSPHEYVLTRAKIKTGGTGILLLCGTHFSKIKKNDSIWASWVKPMVRGTAAVVCTGAITAAAVAAAGTVAGVAVPAVIGSVAVQRAIGATLDQSAEVLGGEVSEKIFK